MNTDNVATFLEEVSYDSLSDGVADRVKRRILDSVGIAIGAMEEDPVGIVEETVQNCVGSGDCTLWGLDDAASPPQAAMYNTALVRYLDFMDSFLAPGETPHPSDNIASAVVCGEYADRSGEDLIEAVAAAYEIQAVLAWNAPVRDRGWDHVTHTIFSATGASAMMLDLDHEETRNALGIAGTAHNALRVTRTGTISMWKGFASANTARNAVYSAMLAGNGMEGPKDVFEGEKGWKHIVAGDFDADLDPGCPSVKKTMAKKYVAETYAQSAVEGVIELVEEHEIAADEIESIHLETFHGAYQIIGGGEGGDRYEVHDKEQADHSLPYMLAVAVLDGRVMNEQYEPER
ncbi:MAG: MmgE/PrpD family protein, partial [Candidatus Nanohaloarchaea archaeon]|nr:MmgE/PrpD family protein [Candidatus Nanohaloarchaea archaeon]